MKTNMFEKLEETIKTLKLENVSDERKEVLQPLIMYIKEKSSKGNPINLNFICTHNSRRSHLSQIWAQALAFYFEVPQVYCYSGGTEATAVYSQVIETMNEQGFEIEKLSEVENPLYSVKFGKNEMPIIAFSKKYESAFNPSSDFAAIMTCSQADEGCPFVAGATVKIPVTYEDPKAFDQTSQKAEKYRERSIQIATELLYVFSKAR